MSLYFKGEGVVSCNGTDPKWYKEVQTDTKFKIQFR